MNESKQIKDTNLPKDIYLLVETLHKQKTGI